MDSLTKKIAGRVGEEVVGKERERWLEGHKIL